MLISSSCMRRDCKRAHLSSRRRLPVAGDRYIEMPQHAAQPAGTDSCSMLVCYYMLLCACLLALDSMERIFTVIQRPIHYIQCIGASSYVLSSISFRTDCLTIDMIMHAGEYIFYYPSISICMQRGASACERSAAWASEAHTESRRLRQSTDTQW